MKTEQQNEAHAKSATGIQDRFDRVTAHLETVISALMGMETGGVGPREVYGTQLILENQITELDRLSKDVQTL